MIDAHREIFAGHEDKRDGGGEKKWSWDGSRKYIVGAGRVCHLTTVSICANFTAAS
jgi:hypothetical protein